MSYGVYGIKTWFGRGGALRAGFLAILGGGPAAGGCFKTWGDGFEALVQNGQAFIIRLFSGRIQNIRCAMDSVVRIQT